jgi:hypothetical protein
VARVVATLRHPVKGLGRKVQAKGCEQEGLLGGLFGRATADSARRVRKMVTWLPAWLVAFLMLASPDESLSSVYGISCFSFSRQVTIFELCKVTKLLFFPLTRKG